ncbi:Asp-tRNA(Asn)/Glu-tRNA(Gln) amidotransferase subunit GatB [candidate division KSB1 bacterium]|nr:Asp-tRNA(Asn)/Glu-tRNA(Gln) amidotransferase subunit GatB [candidate division KSB1 bacterium]
MEFEPVIGLEIHAQLTTKSKIFCRCSTKFGADPNSQVCPVCLGMPGVLPVINKTAVEYAIKMGLATNCTIASHSVFARKNYFYPDLPKGYQISQFEEPLCLNGYLEIGLEGKSHKIGITRIHLEEDAGKSVHAEDWVEQNETLVDVNRCGVPLIEIVSEPDIRSPQQAYAYLNGLRQILQYLEICDGNMEEGSLRCDANISVRPKGATEFGVKTEMKNMNSFRGVEKALEFEIARQIDIIKSGGRVQQETLLWDERNSVAVPMRSKEEAHDYRYFPEPDLLPLAVDDQWKKSVKESMPELPVARRKRFVENYQIPDYDAGILTENRAVADYFEDVAGRVNDAKLTSNWVMGEVLRALNERKQDIREFPIRSNRLAELLKILLKKEISASVAKTVFKEMLVSEDSPEKIVEARGLTQISDSSEIADIIDQVIANNPKEVEKYRSGKTKLFGFLMGQVMKATRGTANPQLVNKILKEKLDE